MRSKQTTRSLLFALVTACLVSVAIELLWRGAYRLMFGEWYSPAHLEELAQPSPWKRIAAGENSPRRPDFLEREILHPYVGFLFNAERPETHGFPGGGPVVWPKDPTRLVIAVTGGSVADSLRCGLEQLFRDHFEQSDSALEPEVVGLGMPGFKQPQQLLAVGYLLSLGGHFDIVINVDGYNDVVLAARVYAQHTFPFFPRLWKGRLRVRSDAGDLVRAGKLAFLQEERRRLAEGSRTSVWRFSAAFGLVQAVRLTRVKSEAFRLESELAGRHGERGTFETDGPYREYESLEELYADSALVWQRSSLLLSRLGAGLGFEYYHFLQPNQYVAGSKVLSEEERTRAWNPSLPNAKHALAGYPHLIRAGVGLIDAGVNYYDATMLFRDRAETLYKDVCCHYNADGVALVARHIVETVMRETAIEGVRR